jgi:hypothetical protein
MTCDSSQPTRRRPSDFVNPRTVAVALANLHRYGYKALQAVPESINLFPLSGLPKKKKE